MRYSELLDGYIKNSRMSLAKITERMEEEKGIKIDRSYLSKLRHNPRYPASEDINRALAEITGGDPEALVTAAYYETAPEEIKKSLDKGTTYERLFELLLDKRVDPTHLPDEYVAILNDLSTRSKEQAVKWISVNLRNIFKESPQKFSDIYIRSKEFERLGITDEDVRRLKILREQKGISVEVMANIMGIDTRTYEIIESFGAFKLDDIDTEHLKALDSYYQQALDILTRTDPHNLLERYNTSQPEESSELRETIQPYDDSNMRRIPVLGSIRAGEPIERVEDIESYTLIDPEVLKGAEGFALRVEGDSMTGDNIYDEFVVVVRLQPEVHPHEIAVVAVHGEQATLKRVRYLENKAILTPSNPAYEQKVYDAKDITVIGKVVEVKFWPKH